MHTFIFTYIYILYILLSLNTEHPWFHNFITPKKRSRKRGFSRSELVINKWTAACLRRNEALDAPWLDTRISALKREGAQPRDQCGGERGSATGGNPFRNFAKYAKNIILFQEFGGWHMLIHYQGCYNIYLHRGTAPRNPSKSLTSIKSIGI